MNFDTAWFENVLSDWDYKEVYVNDRCIYSVDSDVETRICDFTARMKNLIGLTSVKWKSVNITPYKNSGVVIRFEVEVGLWKE